MNIEDTKFYKDFSQKELESLPVNYQLLTYLQFKEKVITSENSNDFQGLEIEKYNGDLISSEKHFSPISKIIDFE